ncbi:hypothetical protein [Haladaptatus salinisoli]|uniref:hypothetical protein n=1 Tax=Haladaptatus salinisoli TaxID=2884876 RepID=UPI001D09ABC5|nr:hypothetical protein [Haladaptatus salinisoli]
MGRDLELREFARGAEFTASEEEVDEAIADAAEELGQSEEEVRENVAYIIDSSFGEEELTTSFNEMVSGAGLNDDTESTGDPRLEALKMYKMRQRI